MRIVFVEVRNFRGIRELDWAPLPGINCLIGPGDSTKTTILDAIELALLPRSYHIADDCDFYDAEPKNPVEITITLADLPPRFLSDEHYGLYLRGWDTASGRVEDEPGEGLEEALSLRLRIDESLEGRWSIFNNRVSPAGDDLPSLRYKDRNLVGPTRLGPYADTHLGWGRQSILTKLGNPDENVTLKLAQAGRAARQAFEGAGEVFKATAERAESLGRRFAVPIREKFSAVLDVQGVKITSGGVALHDGKLPLRRLGTGSARLLVSALQHGAGASHIALIDEIEHGLEPHRIARLLRFLGEPESEASETPQVFITTHSPVVIRELAAPEIFRVMSSDGKTTVLSVSKVTNSGEAAQRHLRSTPEAFLARRLAIGEGRTEEGLLRGLDQAWVCEGKDSFAFRGVSAISGDGAGSALMITGHLLDLGYATCTLLDTDKPAPQAELARLDARGGKFLQWPDQCSTEDRIFLDVPWPVVSSVVELAAEFEGCESVRAVLQQAFPSAAWPASTPIVLPAALDTENSRRALAKVAKDKKWFKRIERGERLAALLVQCLPQIPDTPLARTVRAIRDWVDG